MAGNGLGLRYLVTPKAGEDGAPRKRCGFCPSRTMIVFTVNLLLGLVVGQTVGSSASSGFRHAWDEAVGAFTMFCLSYIMINVGYEFDIDKVHIRKYVKEYLIAMTAAGFPWSSSRSTSCSTRHLARVEGGAAAARFAAPTSAGILFSMLEASGMRETWLFEKARLLAIFDDLDTILLMIRQGRHDRHEALGRHDPRLHRGRGSSCTRCMPTHWRATRVRARGDGRVRAACTSSRPTRRRDGRGPPEVLLPAFTIGCVAAHADKEEHAGAGRAAAPSKEARRRRRSGFSAAPSAGGEAAATHARAGRRDARPAAATRAAATAARPPADAVALRLRALESERSRPSSRGLHARRPRCRRWRRRPRRRRRRRRPRRRSLEAADDARGRRRRRRDARARRARRARRRGERAHDPREDVPGVLLPRRGGWRTRLALSLGMCPRGGVGAGVVVISISMGISGPAITVAVMALTVNLVCSSLFIASVVASVQARGRPSGGRRR